MATGPQQLTLTLIADAGVAFIGILGGMWEKIAPPEMPKFWVILGTITASVAFFSVKVLLGLSGVPVSRNVWLVSALAFVLLAIIFGFAYVLTYSIRTITYNGERKLAGTAAEYRPNVATNLQGRTRDRLLSDAACNTGQHGGNE